jgi:hypothetical protein
LISGSPQDMRHSRCWRGGQTMSVGYVVVKEEEDSGDSNGTLKSSVLLHEIYGEEVFNKADDLIDDAPSLPNATQGTPMKKKMRRPGSRQPHFKRKSKGIMKGHYTYQPKATPRCYCIQFIACRFQDGCRGTHSFKCRPTESHFSLSCPLRGATTRGVEW